MGLSFRDYVLATLGISMAGVLLYTQPWGNVTYLFAMGFAGAAAATVFTNG